MTERDADDEGPEELPALLTELETTLRDLRDELGPGNGRRLSRSPLRPPRFRDVLRFTEEYTIPALIAVLEANIRLLELAGAALRAIDPERSTAQPESRERPRLTTLGESVETPGRATVGRLSDGLSTLQRALSEADLPENPEARRLLEEARSLSTEVQRRLEGGDEQARLSRYATRDEPGRRSRGRGESGPVEIEVTDGEGDGSDEGTAIEGETEGGDESGTVVDVEAELRSIKDDVEGESDESDVGRSPGDDGNGSGAGDEGGESGGGPGDGKDDDAPDDPEGGSGSDGYSTGRNR